LGLIYMNGDGVEVDINRSKEYFGRACDLRNAKGCESYRAMVENGF